MTGLRINSLSLFAQGAREYLVSTFPWGRPRWLIKIKAPWWSSTCWIEGKAALIRVSSVILLSASKGTLKSTRMRTFFPSMGSSFSDSFFPMPFPPQQVERVLGFDYALLSLYQELELLQYLSAFPWVARGN